MPDDHEIEIVVRAEDDWCFFACTCGDEGDPHPTAAAAEDDADAHLLAVKLGGQR